MNPLNQFTFVFEIDRVFLNSLIGIEIWLIDRKRVEEMTRGSVLETNECLL